MGDGFSTERRVGRNGWCGENRVGDTSLAAAVMLADQLLGVLADAVVRVTSDQDLAIGLAVLAMVAIYPSLVAVRDGLAWFGALDGWKQLAVASLVGVPVAISTQSIGALRGITIRSRVSASLRPPISPWFGLQQPSTSGSVKRAG